MGKSMNSAFMAMGIMYVRCVSDLALALTGPAAPIDYER